MSPKLTAANIAATATAAAAAATTATTTTSTSVPKTVAAAAPVSFPFTRAERRPAGWEHQRKIPECTPAHGFLTYQHPKRPGGWPENSWNHC